MSSPREMMQVELEKLQAPLVMLQALSRCLKDDPSAADIRRSLAALTCRTEVLRQQVGLHLVTAPSSSARLTESDQVLGTS